MSTQSNPRPYGFIRPMNPTRDLNAVADLVEAAFELKNDPEGHLLIENMRQHARKLSDPDASFLDTLNARVSWSDGLVWEDRGKVVGNITLIPHMDGFKRVIMIANVSVQDDYRRQGIARELTLWGLRRCQASGVKEVYLQVRHDNASAIRLYADLGFQKLHSVSVWRLRNSRNAPKSAPTKASQNITRRRYRDWRLQKAWLAQAYPSKTRWYAGLSFGALSPYSWFVPAYWAQMMQVEHFALRHENTLLGTLSWQRRMAQIDALLLAMPLELNEDDKNERARALLSHFVNNFWDYAKVNLEYPMGHATQGIKDAGFTLAHDLDWMYLRI